MRRNKCNVNTCVPNVETCSSEMKFCLKARRCRAGSIASQIPNNKICANALKTEPPNQTDDKHGHHCPSLDTARWSVEDRFDVKPEEEANEYSEQL